VREVFESISKVFAIHDLGSDGELTFFAVVVALSAYLATIRFFVIQRGDSTSDKASMRRDLRLLFFGDAPITMAAILVGLHALYVIAPHWFLSLGAWCFTLGGLMLLGHHAVAWKRTWFAHKSDPAEAATSPGQTEVRKVESDISCNGQPLHVTLSLIVPADPAAKVPGAPAPRP
jgi:hypothetical protein